ILSTIFETPESKVTSIPEPQKSEPSKFEPTKPEAPKAEASDPTPPIAQPLKILVAEDNSVNMLLARTILKRIAPNATLLEAKNGMEAVDFCKRTLPDLILMDVQMPEMNGYEATKIIRGLEHGTHVPVIAFTAGNVRSERDAALAAGMDDFVVKPVVEEMIAAVLNKWLHFKEHAGGPEQEALHAGEGKHFDTEVLKRYAGNDEEMVREVIALTKAELKESLLVLESQVRQNDLTGLHATGHKLYGTAASAGLITLSKLARRFEHLPAGELGLMQPLIAETREEIALVLDLLMEILDS
ncbi:MAG: response regulator, partial [Sphingobacteriales bacterium]